MDLGKEDFDCTAVFALRRRKVLKLTISNSSDSDQCCNVDGVDSSVKILPTLPKQLQTDEVADDEFNSKVLKILVKIGGDGGNSRATVPPIENCGEIPDVVTSIGLQDGIVLKLPLGYGETMNILPKIKGGLSLSKGCGISISEFTIQNNTWEDFVKAHLLPTISTNIPSTLTLHIGNLYILWETNTENSTVLSFPYKSDRKVADLFVELPSKFSVGQGQLLDEIDISSKFVFPSSDYTAFTSAFREHTFLPIRSGVRVLLHYYCLRPPDSRTRTIKVKDCDKIVNLRDVLTSLLKMKDPADPVSQFLNQVKTSHLTKLVPILIKSTTNLGQSFLSQEMEKAFLNSSGLEASLDLINVMTSFDLFDSLEPPLQKYIWKDLLQIALSSLQESWIDSIEDHQIMEMMINLTRLRNIRNLKLGMNLLEQFFTVFQIPIIRHFKKLFPSAFSILSWNFFHDQIVFMFSRIENSLSQCLGLLTTILTAEDEEGAPIWMKNDTIHDFAVIMQNIIESEENKNKDRLTHLTQADHDHVDIIVKYLQILPSPYTTGQNILGFLSSIRPLVVVSVLEKLAECNIDKKLGEPWRSMAAGDDFLSSLKRFVETNSGKEDLRPKWRINKTFKPCTRKDCGDCKILQTFMLSKDISRNLGNLDPKQKNHLLAVIPTTGMRPIKREKNWDVVITKFPINSNGRKKEKEFLANKIKIRLGHEFMDKFNKLLDDSGIRPYRIVAKEKEIIVID